MNKRLPNLILTLALSGTLAYSQTGSTPPPSAPGSQPNSQQSAEAAPAPAAAAPAPAQPAQALQPDPQLHSGKLPNGLSYLIRRTTEPKGRASLRLYIDTGSLNESPETKGISHFCEHMVFNGSRTFKRGELIPAMQKLGLGFGGDANAYTGLLQTVYMMDLPNLDDETRNFALRVMRDFADGATFTDEAIEKERGIVISELKSRDSQAYRASLSFISQLLGGTRVPDYMPIGLEEVIRNCPGETIRAYYHDNYVPERMTVILTGDFDPEQAKAWIEQYFGDMKAAPNPPRPDIGVPSDMGPDEKLIPNPESALTSLMLSVISPYEDKPDTLENRVAEMPLRLALSMLNQRFSRLSREQDSPFNSAEADKNDLFRAVTHFALSASAPKEKWQQALTAAENELRRACEYGFQEDELQESIKALLTAAQSMKDRWPTVTCSSMAGSLVDALSDQLTPTAPDEDLRAIIAGLEPIAANPDLCRQALAKAYNADRVKLTMMGDIPSDASKESLRSTFEKARQVKLEAPEKREQLHFAYEHIGTPGTIIRQQHLEDIDTTTLTLSNGIRVNLKPMSERNNSILVRADVDGGRINLPRIPGLSQLTASVIKDGAMEAHSSDDLKRLTMGHTVSLDVSLGEDRFTFSGETNNADLELQCKLLAASILHPGYRPEGEMMLRRNLDSIYTRLQTTPGGAAAIGTAKALFGTDPRFTMPEKEELQAVTTADVKKAVDPYLQHGAMEVTIVGDFTPDAILPILERTFGAMPERSETFTQPTDAQRAVTFNPWGQRKFIRYNTQLDKTLVSRVVYAGDGMDRKRGRRLGVLKSIAGDKVFDGIRAALGESYSPQVILELNDTYKDAALITVASAGVKRNRVKVNSAIDLILSDLGRGNITQEQLDCVLEPLKARTEKSLRTPNFWFGALSQLQSDPQQHELLKNLQQDINSITLEEIQQLARETFGSDRQNYLFTVPENYDENAPDQEPPLTELPPQQQTTTAPEEASATAPEEASATAPEEATATTPEASATEPQKEQTSSTTPPSTPATAATQNFSPYIIILTGNVAQDPDWIKVAQALALKHAQDKLYLVMLPDLSESACADALRKVQARYAAIIAKPEEINRNVVRNLHRAARRVDDDPYGDCIWGIITGYTAEDALRIATADSPLVINRVLGTTNIGPQRFEHSYCITDWGENTPIVAQSGHTEPTTTPCDASTDLGRQLAGKGVQGLFAEELSKSKPQLIVTSSHATQFNLEMPFSKGLIFPAGNRFYEADLSTMPQVLVRGIQPSTKRGKAGILSEVAQQLNCPVIEPDGEPRVWLAAGNCLLGDAMGTRESMAVTALSAYTCNQLVGYTVPSWYGKGGWGTLSLLFENTAGTPLAEAWFLNNQFILADSIALSPSLLEARYDGSDLDAKALQRSLSRANFPITADNAKDAMGLLYDRDVVAFYGDPAWSATLNEQHSPSPYSITWHSDKQFTITANSDREGRCAVWFPTASTGEDATACDAPGAIFTDDFILFPRLKLSKGESLTVIIR